jgi:hypothetical protein
MVATNDGFSDAENQREDRLWEFLSSRAVSESVAGQKLKALGTT